MNGNAMPIFIFMLALLIGSGNAVAIQEVIRLKCTEFLPTFNSRNNANASPGYIEIHGDMITLKSIRGFDGAYAKFNETATEFIFWSPKDEHLWGKLDRHTGRFTVSTYSQISHDFTSELEGAKYWEGVCQII